MTTNEQTDALLRTFLLHRGRMEQSVARRVRCRATASDLIQDLFLRLWQRRLAPDHIDPRYLMRSARNMATDHLRSASVRTDRQEIPADLPDAQPAVDEVLSARQRLACIEAALDSLPVRVREAFLLSRIHGRSCPEIARALGVSVATVERDIARALLACHAAICGY